MQLYNGDCLKVLKEIPDNSVDLVVTDPPYGENIGKMSYTNSGHKIDGGVAKRTDYTKISNEWDNERPSKEIISEIFRVSKNQIIFGGNFLSDLLPISRGWYVWDKRTADKYSNDFADCELVWTSFDIPMRVIRYLWYGMLQEDMKHKEKRVHPTQKPLKIIQEIIQDFSKENDTILDPFLGSGTTMLASLELGRSCIGIEREPKYIDITKKRLNWGNSLNPDIEWEFKEDNI